jgi:hypothetical protein
MNRRDFDIFSRMNAGDSLLRLMRFAQPLL